jgi:hypothetical protein
MQEGCPVEKGQPSLVFRGVGGLCRTGLLTGRSFRARIDVSWSDPQIAFGVGTGRTVGAVAGYPFSRPLFSSLNGFPAFGLHVTSRLLERK